MNRYNDLIDFVDGELSPEKESALMFEVSENPELLAKFKNLLKVEKTFADKAAISNTPPVLTGKVFDSIGINSSAAGNISSGIFASKMKGLLAVAKSGIIGPAISALLTGTIFVCLINPLWYGNEKIETSDSKSDIPIVESYTSEDVIIEKNQQINELTEKLHESGKIIAGLRNENDKLSELLTAKGSDEFIALTSSINDNSNKNIVCDRGGHLQNIYENEFNITLTKSSGQSLLENPEINCKKLLSDIPARTTKVLPDIDMLNLGSGMPVLVEFSKEESNYLDKATIAPGERMLFRDMNVRVLYKLASFLDIGAEYRAENFFLKYHGYENDVLYDYEQQPNFQTISAVVRSGLFSFGKTKVFGQYGLGFNNVGFVNRLMLGGNYKTSGGFGFILGLEYSDMRFTRQNIDFDSQKISLNYGIQFDLSKDTK